MVAAAVERKSYHSFPSCVVCPPCVTLPAFALELLDQQKANIGLIWMCADFV